MSSIIPNQPSDNFQTFHFGGYSIRAKLNEDNNPVFIASDVCKALKLTNVSQALSRLDVIDKSIITNDMGVEYTVVTETGLYLLIFSSRTEAAQEFKRWIVQDVLPSIRKTGSYTAPNLSALQVLRQMLDTFEEQSQRIDNLDNRVGLLEAHVQPELDYYTIMGYCHKHKLTVSTNQAMSYGQRAKRLSTERNISVGKIADPRYGEVNTYHVSILDEVVGKG